MSAISQSTVAESPLATEPDAFTSYFAELVIGCTDVVVFRAALREFFTESAPLVVAATSTTSNRHDYVSDAVMYSAESGVAYEFNKLTPEQLAESPGIPVGPISLNTIGDEQYIGYQNTHWNRDPAVFEIGVTTQEVRARGFISSATLEIGLTGTAVYREAVRLNVVDTINLNTGVTELHYFFADADRTISPGIPVGPISVNTISQEQFIGHQFNHWNRDPAPLEINAVFVERRIFNRPIDYAPIEFGAIVDAYKREAVRLNVTDPAALVFGYSELNYYFPGPDPDRGVPLPIGPISIAAITELQYVPGEYGKTYTFADTIALELDVTFTYTYPTQALAVVEETVELVWFGISLPTVTHNITSTANLAVVEIHGVTTSTVSDNTAALNISASADVVQKFVFADTGNLAVVEIHGVEYQTTLADSVALTLSATSVVKRIALITDSTSSLEITTTDLVSRKAIYDTTTAVTIADTSTATFSAKIDTTLALELNGTGELNANKIYPIESTGELLLDSVTAQARTFAYTDTANLAVVDIVANETTSATDNTVALAISATAVVAQKFVFADTGNLAVVDIASTEIASNVDNTVALAVSATTVISRAFAYSDTANLAVVDIVANETTTATDNTAALAITATTVFATKLVYADTATTEIAVTTETVKSSTVVTSAEVTVNASDTILQKFVFADTANLAVVDIQSVEYTSNLDNTVALTVSATDTISRTAVYADTGNLAVVDIVANETTSATDNTVALEIGATTVFSRTFAYADTGNLAVVDIVVETTASAIDNTAVLAISATVAVEQQFVFADLANLAVVDIQSVAIASNVDNDVVLELSAISVAGQTFTFDSSAVLAIVDIVSNEIASNVDNSVVFAISATDAVEQRFNYLSTAAVEIAVEAIAGQTQVFDTTGNVALVDIQSIEYTANLQDSATATLSASEAVEQQFNYVDTGNNELAATVLFGQTFVFDDAAVLAAVNITSIEYTANLQDSSFLDLAATASIQQKFVFDTIAELAVDANVLSGLTYQFADTGNVALVDIQSVEYTSNVDNTVFWEFAVEAAFTQSFNFVNTTELVLTNMPVRSFLSLPATPFDYVKNGNDATVTFLGENRGDGLPGDVAALISALTNTMFFPGPGQQLFIDGSPFQYYGTITDVNVGQLQNGSYEISISLTDAANGPNAGSLVTGTGIQFDNTFVTEFGITRIFNLGEESAPIEINTVASNEITSNVVTDAAVEIATEQTVAQIFNYVDTSDNELAATALFGQTYIFTDTGNLAVVDIVSNELTSNVENTSFFEFVASDTIEQKFNFVETAAVAIAATAEVAVIFAFVSTAETVLEDQNTTSTVLSYTDTGNLAVVDIVANEITSNVETATFFDLVAEQAVEQKFNFVETAAILIGDQNTNTTSLNYVDESNMAVVNIQSISVKYNYNDIPFVTYQIDTAIEQKFNFVETAAAALGADVATSMTMAVSTVTAVDLMAEASNSILSNQVQDTNIDITADYLTQSSRSDVTTSYFADLDVVDSIGITKLIYSTDHIGDIMGYSFAKGYTLFKQEYSNEPIALTLGAVSGEIQVITGGTTVTSSKQIWIG